MRSFRPLRFLAVCWLALVLAAGAGATAQAQGCRITPELDALLDELKRLTWNTPILTAAQSARMEDLVRDVRNSGLADRMRDLGLENRGVPVFRLLMNADQVARTGRIADPVVLASRIRTVDRLRDFGCEDGTGPSASDSWITALLDLSSDGTRHRPGVATPGEMLFLMLSVVAVSLGLYLLHTLYRWAYALIYNLRACILAAELHLGEDLRVEGRVVTLGLRACRFEPADPGWLDRLWPEAERDDIRLSIRRKRFPVTVWGIYPGFIALAFRSRLSLRRQKALLVRSTISPNYIRKSLPKPNIRRRRQPTKA